MRLPRQTLNRVTIAVVYAASAVSLVAADLALPHPSTGNVDGRVGVLYWPALSTRADAEPQLLPANDCLVYLVNRSNLDAELTRPCGQWFSPAAGRYSYWLEQGFRISPEPNVLVYAGGRFEGAGLAAIVPMVDGGRVGVPAGHDLPEGEVLRLVSVDSHLRFGGQGRIFDRRVTKKIAGSPALMPAGRVIIGRFDRKSGDAIALSRPIALAAGKVQRQWPAPPTDGADVLVVLEKPPRRQAQSRAPSPIDLRLGELPPDVTIDSFSRVIAIWYSAPAGKATPRIASGPYLWRPSEISLRNGRVTTLRATLQPLPTVGVSVTIPDASLFPADAMLSVRRPSSSDSLRELPASTGELSLTELPAELLRISLRLGRWQFHRDVDLTNGADANVRFDLQPSKIWGTIRHGRETVAAAIEFKNGEQWVGARSDADGHYETVLWFPAAYSLRVSVDGSNQPPLFEVFRKIDRSQEMNFTVPRTDVTVLVRDAVSGLPISGARATVGSIFGTEQNQAQTVVQPVSTGDDGIAQLPPLRKGRLQFSVRADGYVQSELIEAAITEPEQKQRFEVMLRPLPRGARVTILLPERTPAAGADLWAFRDAVSMQPLWQGKADANGNAEIPELTPTLLLLIRHPHAATTMKSWRARATEAVVWELAAPASALTVTVKTAGGEPARSRRLALWLDGVLIHGTPLAIATWSSPATDSGGTWIGRNLPSSATRVLALGPNVTDSPQTLDALSVPVAYPWPNGVSVVAVE